MSPYYSDDHVTLWNGDALDVLTEMPDGSVDCCVTSPPYFGLRDYGKPGQYGLESSPAEYVARMQQVFAQVRRVLADDGTCWVNVGDSYYSGKGSPTQPDLKNEARRPPARVLDRPGQSWAKPKDLLGIPWRVAFALQDDGWILRNAIVWAKPNAMPESVQDRLANRHELIFMLTKSRRYWFDLDPIREPHAETTIAAASRARIPYSAPGQRPNTKTRGMAEGGANPGDVWSITTQPFSEAHFAVFPPEIPRRAIAAGCKPGGIVLDPFSGSGTTGLAAAQLGRKYVGIDLSADYLDLSLRTRLAQTSLIDGEAS